jgi:hypothetical protein
VRGCFRKRLRFGRWGRPGQTGGDRPCEEETEHPCQVSSGVVQLLAQRVSHTVAPRMARIVSSGVRRSRTHKGLHEASHLNVTACFNFRRCHSVAFTTWLPFFDTSVANRPWYCRLIQCCELSLLLPIVTYCVEFANQIPAFQN